MTTGDTTPANAKSGKGLAKCQGSKASKFSRDYWLGRIYRPRYRDGNGQPVEVSEWRARIQAGGERRDVGLSTNNRQEAARLAADVFAAVKAKGWDAGLAETMPGHVERREATESQTFGQLLTAALADKGADVRPVTLQGYASSVRQLVSMGAGIKDSRAKFDYAGGGRAKWIASVESVPLSKITTEAMQAAIDAKVAAVRADGIRERSTRRTCAAAIREAKSLFSGREWNPFAKLSVRCSAPPQYRGGLDMSALMRSGMAELRESAPEQLAALLLFAGCGLRKSEADAARWCWLDPERGTLTVMADGAFSPKTHASEAPVFVDPGFAAALLNLRPADAPADAYILAPDTAPLPMATFTRYRAAHVFDKLTSWLKAHGVNTRTPLHDLRREFGSFIAQTADIFTASRQLRHSSIQVTASFYTQQRRQVAPSLGAMLAGSPQADAGSK